MLQSLYEDEEILIVDKPAGLASQPGSGVGISLVEAVERDFGFRPYLVHRLDKETQGCIIVARSNKAAARWTELVGSKAVGKVYRAVVAGCPEGVSGVLRDPIQVRGERKEALTQWRLIERLYGGQTQAPNRESGTGERFSYLELRLGTGRTHQIRLHLAQAGLPILGDDLHGDFKLNKALKKACGLKRLMLWAAELELPGGLRLRSSLPAHFQAFFEALSSPGEGTGS